MQALEHLSKKIIVVTVAFEAQVNQVFVDQTGGEFVCFADWYEKVCIAMDHPDRRGDTFSSGQRVDIWHGHHRVGVEMQNRKALAAYAIE